MEVAFTKSPPTARARSYRSVVLVTTLSWARAVELAVAPSANAQSAKRKDLFIIGAIPQKGCGLCGPNANVAWRRKRLNASKLFGLTRSNFATILENSLG